MMTVFMIHHCVRICLFSTVLTIRNYLKKAGCQQQREKWTVQKMPHNQQDAWSCGILVLMVQWLLLFQKFLNFLNYRFFFLPRSTLTLLEAAITRSSDSCSRWAHFECAHYIKDSGTQYKCQKCGCGALSSAVVWPGNWNPASTAPHCVSLHLSLPHVLSLLHSCPGIKGIKTKKCGWNQSLFLFFIW